MSVQHPPSDPSRQQRPSAPTARRRDRHGRGLRSPLLMPHLPGWRTREEKFEGLVVSVAQELTRKHRPVGDIQFAVEEVPPSDPSPWERGVVLGRGFDAEPRAGLPARVVLYRLPIVSRTRDEAEVVELVENVLIEQVAHLLNMRPEDLDYRS